MPSFTSFHSFFLFAKWWDTQIFFSVVPLFPNSMSVVEEFDVNDVEDLFMHLAV